MGIASEERAAGDAELTLCFLCYRQTAAADGYQGGALVTDSSGKPLEFRTTSPVRPNAVQRTLYGANLESYVAQELFGVPLVRALREEPNVILVRDEVLLDIRPRVQCPVLHLRRQGETLHVPTERQPESQPKSELMECPSGRFQPLVVVCHWQYTEEVNALRSQLQPVFARMDLTEPFERVDRALQELERQEATAKA